MACIDLLQMRDEAVLRYVDVCIVGGGMAGLVVADRLVACGIRVAVLESGGLSADRRLDVLNTIDDTLEHYTGSQTGRARLVGGTSTLWGGRLLPLTAHDLGRRDYASIEPWPIGLDELSAQTAAVESVFKLDHTPFERPELARLSGTFGIYPNHDGVSCRFPKFPTFRNRNVATTLKRSILAQEGFAVYFNATVTSFGLDAASGQVSEAVARSPGQATLTVKARHFVFAAGTIETTRLALLLDRISGQRAFAGCEALGRYFQDHLKIHVGMVRPVDVHETNRLFGYHMAQATRRSLHCELSPHAQRRLSIPSAYLDFRLQIPDRSIHQSLRSLGRFVQGKARPQRGLALDRRSLSLEALYKLAFWRLRYRQLYLSAEIGIGVEMRIEQAPTARHRIRLSDRVDEHSVPLVNLLWSPTEADKRTFLSALQEFKRFWSQVGLTRASPVEWSVSERSADDYFSTMALDASHPAGSTRMGIDPVRSVVDRSLRCHHVPNLFLVSASAFPSAGSANPSLTLLQLALRCADQIVREFGRVAVG